MQNILQILIIKIQSYPKIIYYNLDIILNFLQLSDDQWIEFCIFSGCDYCQRIPGFGIKSAYKYIKKYKNAETIFEVLKDKLPENYIDKFKKSKDIFNKIDDSIDIDNLILKKKEIKNEDELLGLLTYHTNLTLKQINNRLKIIKLI